MAPGGAVRQDLYVEDLIQPHYVDALGARHEVPRATVGAIREAMKKGEGTREKGKGRREKGKGTRDE